MVCYYSVMKKKLIFLDFDGVLNDPYYLCFLRDKQDEWGEIDEKRLKILKDICNKTGAELVLSSSWNMRKGVKEFFERNGFKVTGSLGWYQNRGETICKWIFDHCDEWLEDDNIQGMQYAILDDEKSTYFQEGLNLSLDKHLFFTGSNVFTFWTKDSIKCAPEEIGLDQKIADKVIEYLNRK